MTPGEKKARLVLTSEKLAGMRPTFQQMGSGDKVIYALYRYLMTNNLTDAPRGTWIKPRSYAPGTKNLRHISIFIPFPQEVFECCKKISPKRVLGFGGYWHHCLSIKHCANKHGVSEPLLRQTIYYYFKIKGKIESLQDARFLMVGPNGSGQ